jgi:hypothetical protein
VIDRLARPPCPGFAGIESRRASAAAQDRAHRATRRTLRDRRLAAKLDDLLGTVDDEVSLAAVRAKGTPP